MTTAPSSPPDQGGPLAARVAELADLAVSVPLELSNRLVGVVPTVVEKVPAAAGRVRREIELARFIGKLAVDQGVRVLRGRLDAADASTEPEIESHSDPKIEIEIEIEPVIELTVEALAVTELALADYDHLSSAQIVAKLSGLEPIERDQIGAYERAHRHRRTILGKIEQLGRVEET